MHWRLFWLVNLNKQNVKKEEDGADNKKHCRNSLWLSKECYIKENYLATKCEEWFWIKSWILLMAGFTTRISILIFRKEETWFLRCSLGSSLFALIWGKGVASGRKKCLSSESLEGKRNNSLEEWNKWCVKIEYMCKKKV